MENNEILKNLTPEGIKQQQEKIEQNQENNSFKEKDDSLRISEINTEISKKEKDIETTNNSINNIRDSFGLPPNDEIPPSIQSQKDSLEKLNQERLDIETKIQEKEKHQTPEENETKELNSQETTEMTQEEYDGMRDDLKMLNKKIQETRGIINLSEDSFKSEYGRKRYKELNFIGEGKPVRFNQTELQTIGDEMEGVLGKATVKKEQTELEKAREEEQAIFAEFKKFTEENPEEKIPQEMEERYRKAEEKLKLAQEKEDIIKKTNDAQISQVNEDEGSNEVLESKKQEVYKKNEEVRKETEKDKSENLENKEGPKINFPEDINIAKALQGKLSEYKERLGAQMKKDPYKAPEFFADTNYKIAVLEKLLTHGEVNTHELSRELNEKFGSFDVEAFNNACAVIEDYAKTGGKEVSGGTGLKLEKKSEGKTEIIENADILDENNQEDSSKKKSDELRKFYQETKKKPFNLDFSPEASQKRKEKFLDSQLSSTIVNEKGEIIDITEERLKGTKTFSQLYRELDKISGIQGSQKFYTSKELKDGIYLFINDKMDSSYLPNTYGFRDKIIELKNKQQEQKKREYDESLGIKKLSEEKEQHRTDILDENNQEDSKKPEAQNEEKSEETQRFERNVKTVLEEISNQSKIMLDALYERQQNHLTPIQSNDDFQRMVWQIKNLGNFESKINKNSLQEIIDNVNRLKSSFQEFRIMQSGGQIREDPSNLEKLSFGAKMFGNTVSESVSKLPIEMQDKELEEKSRELKTALRALDEDSQKLWMLAVRMRENIR